MCVPEKAKTEENHMHGTKSKNLRMPLPRKAASVKNMGTLAFFIKDTKEYTEEQPLGNAAVRYIHYRERTGLWKRARLRHFLRKEGADCFACQEAEAGIASLPLLRGDCRRLIHAMPVRLLPPHTKHLALFPGEGWQAEAILAIAEQVRFLELIGENLEALGERIGAETGLAVPIYPDVKEEEGKVILRLPGSRPGVGIDATNPKESCRFLPPPPLSRLFSATDQNGDILEALMRFFDFPPSAACVFCRNTQNIRGKSEIFSYKNNKDLTKTESI